MILLSVRDWAVLVSGSGITFQQDGGEVGLFVFGGFVAYQEFKILFSSVSTSMVMNAAPVSEVP